MFFGPMLFSTEQLQAVTDFLHRHCGLYFGDTHQRQLQDALNHRIKKTGHLNLTSYIGLLKNSLGAIDEEFNHLVEELTVGETYFYRIASHFTALQYFVLPQFGLRDEPVNILSAACSSGEEPYSMALLLHHYFPNQHFTITAVDIDRNSLALAQVGRYSKRSVNYLPEVIRDSYFQSHGANYRLDESIKKMVQFRQANLFDAQLALPDNGYDIIFCRNVMIYFSAEKIKQLSARLYRLSRPNGYLFLGDAETLRGYNNEYQLLESHGAFFYQKKITRQSIPVTSGLAGAAISERDNKTDNKAPTAHSFKPPIETSLKTPLKTAVKIPEAVTFLQCRQAYLADKSVIAQSSIKQLLLLEPDHWEAKLLLAMIEAGQGHYARGMQLCLEVNAQNVAPHQSFFVAGVIQVEAKQLDEAKRSFESALFHEKLFFPAHFKLALLHKAMGEDEKAKKSFANVIKTMTLYQHDHQLYIGEFSIATVEQIARQGTK